MSVTRHRRAAGGERGFTLVESLLACALLGVVMLGSSMMLLGGLRALQGGWQRAIAAALAADLLERFRASAAAPAAYALPLDHSLDAAAPGCSTGAPCPPAARVQEDLRDWQARVLRALPAARTQVLARPASAGAPAVLTVEIRWAEVGSAAEQALRLSAPAAAP